MNRLFVVLRPEPGASATVARIEALGRTALSIPLFAVRPLPWTPPDPGDHDALLLTSANAARLAGAGLARLQALPAFTVGSATADTARAAGLAIVMTGSGGAEELVRRAAARGVSRGLLLCGRDHVVDVGGPISRAIMVYASDPLPIDRSRLAAIEGAVALVHSSRAAARLAALTDELALSRGNIRLAAIAPDVAEAAGSGWAAIAVAPQPTDPALLESAARLAD